MTKREQIKEHIHKHLVEYTITIAAVTAGITYIIMREPRAVLDAGADRPYTTGSFVFGRSIFGSVTNDVVTTIHDGAKGHPGFITRCINTDELFATQGDAARTFNIPEEFLSKHLNHGRELQDGLLFERVGVLN